MPAARTLKDQPLIPELVNIHRENYSVYGVYKAEMVRDRLFDFVTELELETAGWVCWWGEVRLYQGLGYRTP